MNLIHFKLKPFITHMLFLLRSDHLDSLIDALNQAGSIKHRQLLRTVEEHYEEFRYYVDEIFDKVAPQSNDWLNFLIWECELSEKRDVHVRKATQSTTRKIEFLLDVPPSEEAAGRELLSELLERDPKAASVLRGDFSSPLRKRLATVESQTYGKSADVEIGIAINKHTASAKKTPQPSSSTVVHSSRATQDSPTPTRDASPIDVPAQAQAPSALADQAPSPAHVPAPVPTHGRDTASMNAQPPPTAKEVVMSWFERPNEWSAESQKKLTDALNDVAERDKSDGSAAVLKIQAVTGIKAIQDRQTHFPQSLSEEVLKSFSKGLKNNFMLHANRAEQGQGYIDYLGC
ncbi:hypothetical protein M426DRAFT_221643 [Hypoxylon sp. CI-4A]|nr:hypothetical protein M426DRAFT_221643 [Hypoxylon sp. CI-4A]